ncbi:MAG TPA: glycosyltransferase family 39 protein, partial [Kofleriaceae bacterium]|nr:glycosyltransferase family 39 protein [Kofleriaceae bacterium]
GGGGGRGGAREGSWYFPRGGPYILGFESPGGEATLAIDGRVVVRGAGRRTERIVYQEGAHAVAFTAPPGARLLWHPPGRRGAGELEYVPPSSLSADGTFDGPGTSRLDGLFAILLVALAAGLGLYLARGALRRIDRRAAAAAGIVFACALAVRLIDLGGAGQTWDEDVNWAAGRNYVTNGLALDFSPASWTWNYQHPPVSKYAAGIGAQLADGYGPARAISALLVALACGLLVFVGRRLHSLRVGVLAGAAAALTPHLVGHGKVVGHEAPAVLLWTVALLAALCVHDEPIDRRALVRRLAGVGALLGLAVGSRFVNVLLAPLLGAVLLLHAPPAWRRRTLAWGAAVVPLAALVVFVAIWPRLWSAPFAHLVEAWDKLKIPHSPEPFLGAITNDPPPHYFLVYLVATAPLGILLAAAAWLARAAHRREKASLTTALFLLAPLLVLFSPVRQDGVRYILPSLMALALAAAAGVDYLCDLVRRPRLFAAAGALLGIYLAIACVRIHPYYLDYYGEQVGGPAGVARHRRFEIAWWGEGVADAIAYVNASAAPGARVHKACVEPSHLTWLRGDLWQREARRAADADWIVVYQPSWKTCRLPADAELVHEVEAQGAPLARVYRRDTLKRR